MQDPADCDDDAAIEAGEEADADAEAGVAAAAAGVRMVGEVSTKRYRFTHVVITPRRDTLPRPKRCACCTAVRGCTARSIVMSACKGSENWTSTMSECSV